MRRYLTFELYGPLASWGDVAVGERRPSRYVPTRSALLGLLAAALGVPRADEAAQHALARAVRVGVLVFVPGTPLRDYHTAQVPTGVRARNQPTRRDELHAGALHTVLSYRDYVQEHFSVGIVPEPAHEDGAPSLAELLAALETPRFALYLGRKSCPLGAPLNPTIHELEGLAELVSQYRPRALRLLEASREFVLPNRGELWWDWTEATIEVAGQHHRWDDPISRCRWQFRPRLARQAFVALPSETSPVPEEDEAPTDLSAET